MILFAALLSGADRVEAIFNNAAFALTSQDYPAAERGFLQVLAAQPRNVAALGNLGVVYSRTRRFTLAIETYQKALRLAPADRELATNLGLAFIKQEQFTAAAPIFEKLAAGPSNQDAKQDGSQRARELLAACRLSLGQFDQAVELLDPLHNADPANVGVSYMLGVALEKLKRPADAHRAFTEMMNASTPAQAAFLMGKASYETGQFEAAAAFLRQAIAADPNIDGAHRELGKALVSLRDYKAAETELRLAPADDPEALYFLGAVLVQAHSPEAKAYLLRAQQLTPDFWGPAFYLGRLYLELGDARASLASLRRAVALKPDEPAIHYQLGTALHQSGRESEARAEFVRVRQLKASTLKSEIDVLTPQ